MAWGVAGCGASDPHSVRGALAAAASAAEADDGKALFRVLDQRSRDALASIVKDRGRAARLVRADYPKEAQAVSMSALGDGAEVKDPAELFAKRCPTTCIGELTAKIGAPVSQIARGAELEVHTAQGGSLRLYRGQDGAWGLVWKTAELADERTRAARELVQIRVNAEVYRRRKALESPTAP
jgi:hypothetical protein